MILILALILNISLLGFFKYIDFFIFNFNFVTGSDVHYLNLALPLAISFFTLQQVTYVVDSYRKNVIEKNFLSYILYVSFFPQLIAGPIVHHSEVMPQFKSLKKTILNYSNISKGIFLFSVGLFKKVVVADTLAQYVRLGFDLSKDINFLESWFVSLGYTMQLYFDFSGYTDMALGIALLFNIKLPLNFNSPYKAKDIQDFWRRWHMTLSRFLRDYVYIPLGGNRCSKQRTYLNLFLTFLIGGIWHGAGWTFVFWGVLHGLAVAFYHFWSKFNISLPSVFARFLTFNFVNIAWVFFRAREWSDAEKVLSGMFFPRELGKLKIENWNMNQDFFESAIIGAKSINGDFKLIFFLLGSFLIASLPNSYELTMGRFKSDKKWFFYTIMLLSLSFYFLDRPSEFLYFNF